MMITEEFLTTTPMFAGIAVVWLAAALLYLGSQSAEERTACSCETEQYRVAAFMRYLGLFIGVSSLALPLIVALAVPEESYKPGDWLITASFGLFFGLCGPLGLMLWNWQVRTCASGIVGLSGMGTRHYLPWNTLREVTLSGQSYKLTGAAKPLYIPLSIERHDELLDQIRRHAPSVSIEAAALRPPDQLIDEQHYRGLDRIAPIAAMISGSVVFATLFFLLPPADALLPAAVSGAMLVAYPILRHLRSRESEILRTVIQIVSILLFFILVEIARSRYYPALGVDKADIDGYTSTLILLQLFGIVLFAANILLWGILRFRAGRSS